MIPGSDGPGWAFLVPLLGGGLVLAVTLALTGVPGGRRNRQRRETEARGQETEDAIRDVHAAASDVLDARTAADMAEEERRAEEALAARLGEDPTGAAADLVNRERSR